MLSNTAIFESHSAEALLGAAMLAVQSLAIPVAIVLFGIAIGLAITLSPSRRTYEIKRPKDE
jgi:hypothetical protein